MANVLFVSSVEHLIVEDAVTGTNRSRALAERIPR